jgi:hypothetical protein
MQLVFTNYLDRGPEEVQRRLVDAVPAGLAAAAARIGSSSVTSLPASSHAVANATGVEVHGLDILEGTEINCEGDAGFTTVRVVVPWTSGDSASGKKLLAANRFAQVLSAEARSAA